MLSLRYIFPYARDFRETRPAICWEHLYGWIDGYGVFFDPVIYLATDSIPEWENGWNDKTGANDFIVTCCRQASEQVGSFSAPGIYVRPDQKACIARRGLASQKEALLTPAGKYFHPVHYPQRLEYDRYSSGVSGWKLSGAPTVFKQGASLAVGFELFSLLWALNGDWPEKRLLIGARILRALLTETGRFAAAPDDAFDEEKNSMRLDFQSYGVNRLFIQWFLEKKGLAPGMTASADAFYRLAAGKWQAGDLAGAKRELKAAFEKLAALRAGHSQLSVYFMEFPHMGILLPDQGFFELEWPEYARELIESYIRQIERHGYRLSLEAGAGCWKNLAERYPALCGKLRELWAGGKLELTNGTYALPYALLSPLLLQYWQFAEGQKTFRSVFGRAPATYQCQENSLTAQMPEMLAYFGYANALHITQNHGSAPSENAPFISWESPAGHGVPALTARNPALARKGMNYYLDLALIHDEFGGKEDALNYVNFQDLGYVPFRVQMIRAHSYAPVWGQYELASNRFRRDFQAASAPRRSYHADDYRISESYFYSDATHVDAFSALEDVYACSHALRQAQLAAWMTGNDPRLRRRLDAAIPSLCILEAHDALVVSGQRRGEFFLPVTNLNTPPYSRQTLAGERMKLAREIRGIVSSVRQAVGGNNARKLLNAEGVALPFARIAATDPSPGSGWIALPGGHYAVGSFGAWEAAAPNPADAAWRPVPHPLAAGSWQVGLNADGTVRIEYSGKTASFAPVDARSGRFKPVAVNAWRNGGLLQLAINWRSAAEFVQALDTHVVFTADAKFAEMIVHYAPGRDFDARDKWRDYLTLEFSLGAPLAKVWRFNPNVRVETCEDRVASPCYLAVETGAHHRFSLLNAGAMFYELDRTNGMVRWLVHVAHESVWRRRMALVFDESESFQLSRAWGQGVIPVETIARPFLDIKEGWRGLSAEGLVESDQLLLSNLSDQPGEFTVQTNDEIEARTLAGGDAVVKRDGRSATIRLGAFEMALANVRSMQRKFHNPS